MVFAWFQIMFNIVCVWLIAIITHEALHLWYFKRVLNKQVGIRFEGTALIIGNPSDYEGMTLQQNSQFLGVAVVGGFLIFLPFLAVLGLYVGFALIPYVFMSMPDLKALWEMQRKL